MTADGPTTIEGIIKNTPLGRLVEPEDIADTVASWHPTPRVHQRRNGGGEWRPHVRLGPRLTLPQIAQIGRCHGDRRAFQKIRFREVVGKTPTLRGWVGLTDDTAEDVRTNRRNLRNLSRI